MDPLAGAIVGAGPAPAVANDPLAGAQVGGTAKVAATPAAPAASTVKFTQPPLIGSEDPLKGATTTPVLPTISTPKDTSNVLSKFLGYVGNAIGSAGKTVGDAINKAITPPTQAQLPAGGNNTTLNTLAFLPSELARQIPGVADLQDDPSLSQYITPSEVGKSVGPALFDTATGLAKAPITAGADLWDAARTFVGKNPNASFTLPVLGKVTSNQLDAADAIRNGADPLTAAISAGSAGIFNTLFFADVINRIAGPRAVTVAKATGPNINDYTTGDGTGPRPTIDTGAKTGRLYQPPVGTQVIPPGAVAKLGVNLGDSYDPTQPAFFKVTAGKGGALTGEVVQLKPSYLSTAYDKLFGTSESTAPATVPQLLGAGKDIKPSDLGILADKASPANTIVLHSQSVNIADVKSGLNDTLTGKTPTTMAPVAPGAQPNVNVPPSHTVSHNILRLSGADTTNAKEGSQILAKDIKDAIAEHGDMVTHQALQDKLGVDSTMANRLITEAKMNKTPAEQEALKNQILSKIVTPEGQPLAGVNPKQPTRLSNEEAAPLAEKAANHYYISKIAPAIKEGRMITLNADDLKKHFGEDYNDNNHPIYSQATIKIVERALKENKDSGVIMLGGGPGSGKSEILAKDMEEKGFKGIVYDSNLSNPEGARKFMQMARDAGKKVRIVGMLPNLEKARGFTLQREEATKRGITDNTFANGHHGFPDTVRQLIESGDIKEEHVKLLDTRNFKGSLKDTKALAKSGGFTESPLATLENLGYDKEEIKKLYAKENYTKQADGTFSRRSIEEDGEERITGEKSNDASAAYRTNSQRGFVNPEQIIKDTAAAVQKIQATIKELENIRELSGDIRDAGYQHENKRVANRQRLINLANEVGDMLDAKGWENLVHYVDARAVRRQIGVQSAPAYYPPYLLTPDEKRVFEAVGEPLLKAFTDTYTEYRALGGESIPELSFLEETTVPRFVKEKGGAIDKMLNDFKQVGKAAKNTLQNGGLLSKSLGSMSKSRVYRSLTDEKGKRTVAAVKAKKVTQIVSGKSTDLGKLEFTKREDLLKQDTASLQRKVNALQNEERILSATKSRSEAAKVRLSNIKRELARAVNDIAAIENSYNDSRLNERVFVGSDDKVYTIGQATISEIEEHTSTRYHKNFLANMLVALDRATNALNAMRLLDRIKNEDEFGDIIRKDNPDEAPPEGWKSVGDILPQFRGYHLEPRAAEVLTDLANRQKGQMHIPVIDEINNFLVGAIVFNPVMHVPNVIAGRSTAASALGVPAKSLANLHTAINEVKTAGPLYLDYLEHGAPFMALKATTKNFTDAILNQYTDEIENEKDPGFLDEHEQLAKILGYTNPAALAKGIKHINETATWGSNDVLFMHALLDYKDVHGGTMEEAIKAVSKYMADYRIPERVGPGQFGRVLSQTLQSRAFLFGRFHYSGVIKPWLEAAKDGAGPGSTGKQRLQGLRALAYMLAMGLIVWPYINKMWQGITGSPTSYESMPGPLRPIQVAEKGVQQGVAGIPNDINSIFTVSPALRSMIELGFNTDLFTRNPIYGQLPAEGLSAYGTSVVSPLASASRMNPGDFALSLFGIWTPKNVPAKTTLTTMKYDELPALQTQVKKDIAAGNQKKANDEMAEFNTRAIATWNQYELEIGGTDLVTTDAEKQAFLKEYGIKEPGAVALTHANTLYGDGSLTAKSSLLSNIATYAKAVGVSPDEAFHLIFSGQTIARVSNFGLFDDKSAIIVERMPLDASEQVKSDKGATEDQVLDHVIPLEAGGTNDVDNLNLIPSANNEGEQHTFENALGDAVKAGKITQAQVREYSIRYKVGQGETLPDAYMQEFESKYGSKTMTLQEVEDAIAGK